MDEKEELKKKRKEYGAYLAELRYIKKNVSVRDVAKATGISNPYLYQVESGRKAMTDPISFRRLAAFFEVPVEDLLKKAGYLPDSDPYKILNDQYEAIRPRFPGFPPAAEVPAAHKREILEIHKIMEDKYVQSQKKRKHK